MTHGPKAKNKNRKENVMKNSKITKILIFTLTVALLAVTAFAFSVSAEETAQTDPELEIAGKNIVYGDTFTIQYAVSTSKITADAELVIGNSAGVLGSAKFSKTETTDKITGTEDTYYVFEVTGIPASDVCEDIIVHVEDGDKVGPELKYSLGEYFYERLYADDVINATEGKALYQKDLYLNYLAYAASAQNLFKNFENGENVTLVTNRYYAYVQDGTINGGDSSELFDPSVSASATLAYTGNGADFSGWNVTTYNSDGLSTVQVGPTATVALTGHTVITPAYLTTLTEGENFDDLTTLKGDGTDSDVKFGIGTFTTSDGSVVEGDEIKIVKDPTGRDNNVLMFKDGSTSNYSSIWISVKSANGKATNGISTFETKLYVPKSEILSAGALAQPQYGASSGGRLCYENLVISDDKSYMYFDLDNTDGAETTGNITTDAWHTLRLEFYNYASGAGTPIIKIYVDNLYAGYTEVTTVKDTTGFRWASVADAKFTIYFDNMSLTEKAMPTE